MVIMLKAQGLSVGDFRMTAGLSMVEGLCMPAGLCMRHVYATFRGSAAATTRVQMSISARRCAR